MNSSLSFASSCVDVIAINQYFGNEPKLLRELIEIFQEQLPELLLRLETAAAHSDLPALKRAAHQYIGSCIVFAATETLAAARELEARAEAGNPEVDALVHAVEASAHRLAVELGSLAAEVTAEVA